MKIKTNYYYRSKDGVLRDGGMIEINRYRIISAEGRDIPENGIVYYSTSADDILKVDKGDNNQVSVKINRIITEKEYTSSQIE